MDSIILVGPPASGKTSVGKVLSSKSALPFIDGDSAFASRYGAINYFVELYGWDEFRRLEAETLADICEGTSQRIILAPGGSAVAHNHGEQYRVRNVESLRKFGSVFYLLPYSDLEKSAIVLASRVEKEAWSSALRPSLAGNTTAVAEMLTVLNQRHNLYVAAAHHVVYTGNNSPETIGSGICNLIRSETTPRSVTV